MPVDLIGEFEDRFALRRGKSLKYPVAFHFHSGQKLVKRIDLHWSRALWAVWMAMVFGLRHRRWPF